MTSPSQKEVTSFMRIIIGADHAGFLVKEKLKVFLRAQGHTVVDEGAHTLVPDDDYPDIAFKVAKKAVTGKYVGILLCGSAAGVCIAANKVKGTRAVVAGTKRDARCARMDDHANILCLSGRWWSWWRVKRIVNEFLNTPFSQAPRHTRRIRKITEYERRQK